MLCRSVRAFVLHEDSSFVTHLPPLVLGAIITHQAASLKHLTLLVPGDYMPGDNYAILVSLPMVSCAGVRRSVLQLASKQTRTRAYVFLTLRHKLSTALC